MSLTVPHCVACYMDWLYRLGRVGVQQIMLDQRKAAIAEAEGAKEKLVGTEKETETNWEATFRASERQGPLRPR